MTDPAAAYPSPPTISSSPDPGRTAEPFFERAAMSSSQPGQSPAYGGSSGGASGSGQGQDKSPLSTMNMGFLKTLTEKRITRDGNPQKRRGPKPDSKPALTRRQELNRQAQRTHRERKELYIKALEDEVLRLKEIFSNMSQDKEKLSEENKQLKTVLVQNGINVAAGQDEVMSNTSVGYTSSASVSGHSYAPGSQSAFTPPLTSQSTAPSVSPSTQIPPQSNPASMGGQQLRNLQAQQQQGGGNRGVDYEQAGIDFVLTLEKPCMDHMPWLLERATETGGEPCGHALMASCPPEPFPELTPDIPFGYAHVNGDLNSGQRTWELKKGDLATLLDLSKKLDLDGEITPVMAWGMVLAHPRLVEMGPQDFIRISDDLKNKVRCYGFGAVMEEFEVRDAVENVFSTKPEIVAY